jgi:hypothetical protein
LSMVIRTSHFHFSTSKNRKKVAGRQPLKGEPKWSL